MISHPLIDDADSILLSTPCSPTEILVNDKVKGSAPAFLSLPRDEKEANPQRVSFSNVHVQTYTVEYGTQKKVYPLTLGWRVVHQSTTTVDSHQDECARQRQKSTPPTRLSPDQRRQRLKSMGYSNSDVNRAERRRRTESAMPLAFSECLAYQNLPLREQELVDRLLS
jgi:hypothetical protein